MQCQKQFARLQSFGLHTDCLEHPATVQSRGQDRGHCCGSGATADLPRCRARSSTGLLQVTHQAASSTSQNKLPGSCCCTRGGAHPISLKDANLPALLEMPSRNT